MGARPPLAELGVFLALAAALEVLLARALLEVLLALAVLEALLRLGAPQLRPLQAASNPKAGGALGAPSTRACLLGEQQYTG